MYQPPNSNSNSNLPPYGAQQLSSSYSNANQPFLQQQNWMAAMAQNQQQQQMSAVQQLQTMAGQQNTTSLAMSGGNGALKRQLSAHDDAEAEKENYGAKRALLEKVEPPMPDGPETEKTVENSSNSNDDGDDDAEDEEDSRSTKTDSSPEISSSQQQVVQQQHPHLMQQLYATPQQQQAVQGSAMPSFTQFGMMPSTPLAQSTPFTAAYANMGANNALKNIQQAAFHWSPSMMAAGATHFPSMGGHYGAMAGNIGTSCSGPLPNPTAPSQQQHFLNVYGGLPPNIGNYTMANPAAAAALMVHQHQQQQHAAMLPGGLSMHTTPSHQNNNNNNSSIVSSIGRDSGLGTDKNGEHRDAQKNESSSGGSSEESALGVANLGGSGNEVVSEELEFPPYYRSILLDGRKQLMDLEKINFDKPVPARLAVLNNNKKYWVSLAEIHRRVSIPECLNCSYLSGILRRAKNSGGGERLRKELSKYDCGIDIQSGKRKSSQVTTFTTLCEREAIQLADDFAKVTNDPQNGFPHQQLAQEMSRRQSIQCASPEQRSKRRDEIRGTIEILHQAIAFMQQVIEVETQPLATTGDLVNHPHLLEGTQLDPQTLNQFKRFARLSHCFGNRSVLTSWQTLLTVFGHFEQIVGGDHGGNGGGILPLDFGKPGNSNLAQLPQIAGTSQKPISAEQADANKLLQMIVTQRQHRGQ